MNWKKSTPQLIKITALLVILDTIFKYLALRWLPLEGNLLDPGILMLSLHMNHGIAFNLALARPIVIILTLIIGAILIYAAKMNYQKNPRLAFFCTMIVIGAAGNLFDRIYYGFTVDYIILFGRSAINLADLVIVSGVIGVLVSTTKHGDPGENLTEARN